MNLRRNNPSEVFSFFPVAVEKNRLGAELAGGTAQGSDPVFFCGTVYYGQGGDALTVYLDLVVLLNFLVDFLLLMGTNRLSGFPPCVCRLLLAAALGAAYGGVCMLPEFWFMGSFFWRVLCLVIMAGIAFGWNRSAWKRGGMFLILSMSLGGVALCFGKSDFFVLVLGAIGLRLLCAVAFGKHIGSREYVTVKLSYGGRTESVIALRDTGNGLQDPVTGESVLVISGIVAEKLLGLTQNQIRSPLETMMEAHIPGLRLIPYRCVGNPSAMMLAMPFDNCCIGGMCRRTLVAFAPDGLGKGEVFQALAGGAI